MRLACPMLSVCIPCSMTKIDIVRYFRTSTKLYGVTCQKKMLFIVGTVKTSNPTQKIIL